MCASVRTEYVFMGVMARISLLVTLAAQVCLCLCVSRTLASLECVWTVVLVEDPGPHMLMTSVTPGDSPHPMGTAWDHLRAPKADPSVFLSSFLLLFRFCCL